MAERPRAPKDRRIQQLKTAFDAAHKHGMEGLAQGDYVAFGEAIRKERDIIEAQAREVAERTTGPAKKRKADRSRRGPARAPGRKRTPRS